MLKPTGPKNAGGDYANNYTQRYSPDDPISGKRLMGVDQAAMEARQRLNSRGNGIDWQPGSMHDYEAVSKMERRKNRGGSTFGKKDTMGCD